MEMKIETTTKEREMLKKIRDCEFHDGRNPVEDAVWLNVIAGSKVDGGVVTSLQSKGLVKVELDSDPRESVIYLTSNVELMDVDLFEL
jgi:hypothetical protein